MLSGKKNAKTIKYGPAHFVHSYWMSLPGLPPLAWNLFALTRIKRCSFVITLFRCAL